MQIFNGKKYVRPLKVNFSLFLNRKRKVEVDKTKVMKDLGKMAKLAKNAIINHDAYLQADAEAKDYKLDKFRAKIKAAVSDSEESDTAGNE